MKLFSITKRHKTYGSVFKIQFFTKIMVVKADQNLTKVYNSIKKQIILSFKVILFISGSIDC